MTAELPLMLALIGVPPGLAGTGRPASGSATPLELVIGVGAICDPPDAE